MHNRILMALLIIFFTVTGLVSGSERNNLLLKKILDSLTAIVSGPCYDEYGAEHYCVKCTKKGEEGFFLVVLSEDRSEEIIIIHVLDKSRTIVWQKGVEL